MYAWFCHGLRLAGQPTRGPLHDVKTHNISHHNNKLLLLCKAEYYLWRSSVPTALGSRPAASTIEWLLLQRRRSLRLQLDIRRKGNSALQQEGLAAAEASVSHTKRSVMFAITQARWLHIWRGPGQANTVWMAEGIAYQILLALTCNIALFCTNSQNNML